MTGERVTENEKEVGRNGGRSKIRKKFRKVYKEIGKWENDTAYCGFENVLKDNPILVH